MNEITIKNNYDAIVAPTVKDDGYNGYSRGSFQINILTGTCYICTNNILNGAVQKPLSTADISELLIRLDTLEIDSIDYDDRLFALENDSSSNTSIISNLQIDSTEYDDRLDVLELDSSINYNKINILYIDSTSQNIRLDNLESYDISLNDRLNNVEVDSTSYKGRITNLEIDTTSHDIRLDDVESDITNILINIDTDESTITNHNLRIINLENYDTSNTSDINNINDILLEIQNTIITDQTNSKLSNLLDVDLSTLPIDEQVLKYDSTNSTQKPQNVIKNQYITFNITDEIEVIIGKQRQYPPAHIKLVSVQATISTVAVGSDILLNIKKNGSSILGGSNLSILRNNYKGNIVTFNDITMTTSDQLTIDVLQIGSTFSGSDLAIRFTYNFI